MCSSDNESYDYADDEADTKGYDPEEDGHVSRSNGPVSRYQIFDS